MAVSEDVSDEDWEYLALVREDSPQRVHDLRQVFHALRYMAKTGGQWRMMPHDFPPWEVVYPQARRWMVAKVFEAMSERKGEPTGTILDARTMQSTPESGARAGYDGHKRRKGSKVYIAVDTLGNLLSSFCT